MKRFHCSERMAPESHQACSNITHFHGSKETRSWRKRKWRIRPSAKDCHITTTQPLTNCTILYSFRSLPSRARTDSISQVKDSYRLRALYSYSGIRYKLIQLFDAASGWIAAVFIGCLTACVAFLVDVSVETVSASLGYLELWTAVYKGVVAEMRS